MADSDLNEVQTEPGFDDEDYACFERGFEQLTGIRLDLYKEKQMRRRINTLIGRKGIKGYAPFLRYLRSDTAALAELVDYITINVTEFFRTPDQWGQFETEALPDLLRRSKDRLKIWSCACSSGEEPYSLAMSLLKLTDPSHFHIIATDIDEKMLHIAREGKYSGKSLETLPEEMRTRFFVQDGDKAWASDELKSCVEFLHMDLLQDPFPEACDLIVCRNVLIYFTEQAKETIYIRFKESLRPGGYLFTGNTEQIIYYKKYGFIKIRNYLYRNEEEISCDDRENAV